MYQLNVDRPFRRPGGVEGLHAMLNGRFLVTVNDSASNAVLASAILDQPWGFAQGESTWVGENVALMPGDALPPSVTKVRASS